MFAELTFAATIAGRELGGDGVHSPPHARALRANITTHSPFHMISFRAFSLALAMILVPAAAMDAAAQNQRPIRRSEVVAAQAADVHQLVERLRPAWLEAGGDPSDPAARARVRVWVGDTQVGGLEALRGLTTDKLFSVRLVGREVARARDPRLSPDVVGAVLVRYEDAPPEPGRVELTAGIGRRGEIEPRVRQSFEDAGFDLSNRIWDSNVSHPLAMHAAARVRLRSRGGVSLGVLHTAGHNVRGIPPEPPFVGVSNRFSTTDVAAALFVEPSRFRLSAGPALRLLRYRQTTGGCECNDPVDGSEIVPGAAADASVTSPAISRMHLELTYAARWFPSHSIPAYQRAPEMDLGGFTTYFTLSAGFGF